MSKLWVEHEATVTMASSDGNKVYPTETRLRDLRSPFLFAKENEGPRQENINSLVNYIQCIDVTTMACQMAGKQTTLRGALYTRHYVPAYTVISVSDALKGLEEMKDFQGSITQEVPKVMKKLETIQNNNADSFLYCPYTGLPQENKSPLCEVAAFTVHNYNCWKLAGSGTSVFNPKTGQILLRVTKNGTPILHADLADQIKPQEASRLILKKLPNMVDTHHK